MTNGDRGPELLELGPPRPPSRRRRWSLLLLVLLVLLTGGLVVRLGRPDPVADLRPDPFPSESTRLTPEPRSPAATAPVVLRRGGTGLPGFVDGDLYLRTADAVLRVQLARGRVTATPAGAVSTSWVGFLAVRGGVVLLPTDGRPGVRIPDGRAAQPLPGRLQRGSQVLPGPDGLVWVSESFDGRSSSFALTDLDGVRTGRTVRENGYFLPDGRGGLLLSDIGGVYESRRAGWRRLTTGSVVATGPHHLLVFSCDRSHVCAVDRVDRRTRVATRVEGAEDLVHPYDGGRLSPDGRFVASVTHADDGRTGLQLLDLDEGRLVEQAVVPSDTGDTGDGSAVLAWSADSRWLLTLDRGSLVVVDPVTGSTDQPDLGLPSGLLGLALRPPLD